MCVCSLSVVSDSAIPWTLAHQIALSMRFSRQEYWRRLPFPPPRDLPDSGKEPMSPVLPASPAVAAGFFTTRATWDGAVTVCWNCRYLTLLWKPSIASSDSPGPWNFASLAYQGWSASWISQPFSKSPPPQPGTSLWVSTFLRGCSPRGLCYCMGRQSSASPREAYPADAQPDSWELPYSSHTVGFRFQPVHWVSLTAGNSECYVRLLPEVCVYKRVLFGGVKRKETFPGLRSKREHLGQEEKLFLRDVRGGSWYTNHRVNAESLSSLINGLFWGASQVALLVKNPPVNAGDAGDVDSMPRLGRSPEQEMATHSIILAWRFPKS